MRWNLPDVGIPNCVPEYFREQFEKEEHEAQLRWERMEHYKANQKKRKEAYEAGFPVLDFGVMMPACTARMQTMIPRPALRMISTV